ncbi:MAG TPA: hypothetical protein VHR72_09340 [Gemmataceae bacterium]|jgi:hypothetical protein|nr:hypothetical protein [Gemmataceae bacterium]
MSQMPFLTIHEYHLSREKARAKIKGLLAGVMKLPLKKFDWFRGSLNLAIGDAKKTISLAELEREARLTGAVGTIQRVLDQRDSIFGGTFDSATPNWQITVKSEWAGWKGEVQGPCRIGLAVDDLTEDILYYRKETCLASSDYTFRTVGRNYRGFISSCMSLVDAFINRHILVASNEGFDSPAFAQLKEARGMEERLDSWLKTCSDKTLKDIAGRKEWCHFQELRQERNALMHATAPFSVYSIREIGKRLNYVRTGIGDLLFLLRGIHNKGSVGFIDRLRSAPEVQFHQINVRAGS